MWKSLISGLIALMLVLGCGILEVVVMDNRYEKLHAECLDAIQLAKSNTLTVKQYNTLREHWVKVRETSELLLPHTDVYELNLRFAEGQAYAEQQDFEQLEAQLWVIEELLRYVPHLMTPSLNHLV